MAERGVQENNGSPMGYGQPRKRRGMDRRVVMDPQAEQLAQYGNPYNKPELEQGEAPQPTSPPRQFNSPRNSGVNPQGQPKLDPATGQWSTQPVGKPQQMPEQQKPSGLYDALNQSIQNGYTDIGGDTTPWKTGQYMGQLSGFNTGGWGSGERGTGTLKNRFGQIASNYDVTQKGALSQLMQDPQFLELTGGKATIVPHANQDLLDIDGPDGPMAPIDVIQSATDGGAGQAWAWQPQDQQGGQDIVQQDWWNGQDMGMGPMAPANQLYNQAFQGMNPQQTTDQAMQFLQWLLQQQQSGQLMGGTGESPVTF